MEAVNSFHMKIQTTTLPKTFFTDLALIFPLPFMDSFDVSIQGTFRCKKFFANVALHFLIFVNFVDVII